MDTIRDRWLRFCSEVVSAGNLEVADRLVHHDVVSHNPLPGQQPGLAGFKDALMLFRAAFPDLRSTPTHIVCEGSMLASRCEVTATHQGDFMGIAATGRTIRYEEMIMVRFDGGLIVEHWSVADAMSIMAQLGVNQPGG